MKNGLPKAGWLEKAAYILGWRKIFLVEGNSMLPTLSHGDCVFINPRLKPQIGDIVLARHPFKQSVNIIKRVGEITADGRFFLVGDNAPESTDSRSFGAIQAKDILGVAVSRFIPKDKKEQV
jgi:nickel-type superoxide dismutase maturation protease